MRPEDHRATMTPAALPVASRPSGVWPSPLHECLLRAGIRDAEDAHAAFERWHESVGSEGELDPASIRLLPLVRSNLRRHAIEHPLLPLLEHFYATSGRDNQKLFEETATALARLERAGIPTLLLKGAPLATSYYRDPAERPMADTDIAVPTQHARAATREFEAAGFAPAHPVTRSALRFRHSVDFHAPGDVCLDLHWHVLFDTCQPGLDDAFWTRSRPFELLGVSTRTLDPTDTLLHVIVHGTRWSEVRAVRWVADAAAVLRKAQAEIDWDRMLDDAQRLRVVLRLREGLRYLAQRLSLEIPPTVLDRLDKTRVHAVERAESRVDARDRERIVQRPGSALRVVLVDYWRLHAGAGIAGALLRLPSYLRFRWRLRGHGIRLGSHDSP